jgi:hypothetical protein
MTSSNLQQLRARAEAAWTHFQSSATTDKRPFAAGLFDSWSRSRRHLPEFRDSAPVAGDLADLHEAWQHSPLRLAAQPTLDELLRNARSAGMVAALSDENGRLMWTAASREMRGQVERVNFTVGACWSETAFGTNAVAVAVREGRPATVFSAEHYAPAIHDWVCYAAPILHPASGRVIGAIDLSTTWERHNPLALRAIQAYASEIAMALPAVAGQPIGLRLMGSRAQLRTERGLRQLTPRQGEILAVLALRPGGLHLDALHAEVYGDEPVALGTLKSELSQLRRLLPESSLGSRPYRLLCPVLADVLDLLEAIRTGDAVAILRRYPGPLLPRSESPLLVETARYIEAAVEQACRMAVDSSVLAEFVQRIPEHPEAAARLLTLLDGAGAAGDMRRGIALGRLAASRDP